MTNVQMNTVKTLISFPIATTLGLAVSSLFFIACFNSAPDRIDVDDNDRELDWVSMTNEIRSRDIAVEIEIAIASKNYSFVGIQSNAPFFPGLPKENERVLLETFEFRFIAGTSDVYTSDEQVEFQDAAFEYAKNYNSMLHERLKQDGLLEGL